jgi:hypothetical protein
MCWAKSKDRTSKRLNRVTGMLCDCASFDSDDGTVSCCESYENASVHGSLYRYKVKRPYKLWQRKGLHITRTFLIPVPGL